jgi:hypothetical protein
MNGNGHGVGSNRVGTVMRQWLGVGDRASNRALQRTAEAALLLLFSLVASGQINLRRIDGWQNIDVVLNQHSPVAT